MYTVTTVYVLYLQNNFGIYMIQIHACIKTKIHIKIHAADSVVERRSLIGALVCTGPAADG